MIVNIRWMIKADLPRVLEIEGESFADPWPEEDFIRVLRQPNCIGMVAEIGEVVVGFMIYRLGRRQIELLNLAVAHAYRRKGIGSQLVDKLKSRLQSIRRKVLRFDIADFNLLGHIFLRSQGLISTEIIPERYCLFDHEMVDAYRFEFRLNQDQPVEANG